MDPAITKDALSYIALRPFQTSNPTSAELHLMHSSHFSFP